MTRQVISLEDKKNLLVCMLPIPAYTSEIMKFVYKRSLHYNEKRNKISSFKKVYLQPLIREGYIIPIKNDKMKKQYYDVNLDKILEEYCYKKLRIKKGNWLDEMVPEFIEICKKHRETIFYTSRLIRRAALGRSYLGYIGLCIFSTCINLPGNKSEESIFRYLSAVLEGVENMKNISFTEKKDTRWIVKPENNLISLDFSKNSALLRLIKKQINDENKKDLRRLKKIFSLFYITHALLGEGKTKKESIERDIIAYLMINYIKKSFE